MDKFDMEKIKKCLDLVRENMRIVKIAAIIIVIVVALLFFVKNGEKDQLVLPEENIGKQGTTVDTNQVRNDDKKIYVDISGEVKTPGVYMVEDGTRLFQVINMAGGLTAKADSNSFNQAEAVTDGEKIIIPDIGQASENETEGNVSGVSEAEAYEQSGLININTADISKLQEIKGVGPATAEKIIAYRTVNGNFSKIEDIKNVSGIGDKTFEKMKAQITV